ncbi:hypothetical protein OAJ13_00905 [Euryarchaeota archaeon]|nr:hypothetical protein [Euryarchaeota archaeon]|tara:strand:- start:451 stop:669 length:219 start_codon:yes stop_codon:yes gene_type:complete
MAEGAAMATITLIGAFVLIIIFIINLIFFLNQDRSFIDWLKYVTSRHRLVAIFEIVFSIIYVFEFLSIFFLI